MSIAETIKLQRSPRPVGRGTREMRHRSVLAVGRLRLWRRRRVGRRWWGTGVIAAFEHERERGQDYQRAERHGSLLANAAPPAAREPEAQTLGRIQLIASLPPFLLFDQVLRLLTSNARSLAHAARAQPAAAYSSVALD